MFDIQDLAQEALTPRNLTYTKFIGKKRGRSCTRKEKKNTTTETRVMRDKLAVSFAEREYRRELRAFEKTMDEVKGRGIKDMPTPEFLYTLKQDVKLHENNLQMAKISHAAMKACPPLS